MLTDRAPFDYIYLSRRLLTDLFEHDEAVRTRWRGSFGFNLRFLFGQFNRSDVDKTNLRALAKESSRLVSDNTGDLATPGVYVRDRLELYAGEFEPLMGWTGGKVACYRGESFDDAGCRVLLALFGSASNVVGRRATEGSGDGFYPSDMHGLYSILDAARERADPEIQLDYRLDDLQMSEQARVSEAISFVNGGARQAIGAHDFLARVFFDVEKFEIDHRLVGRVIIGTPLWIATPRPQAFDNIAELGGAR